MSIDASKYIPGLDQEITAGGKRSFTVGAGSTAPVVCFGSGAPTLTVPIGSIYLRTDGSSSSTRLYMCSVANGTWVAITTAS